MEVGTGEATVIERDAIRAILLTPDRKVFLLRILPPDGDAAFWITPGGGVEPDETPESALRRELREELGLEEFTIGPLVWRRQHTFNWGPRRLCQREQYHIVHVESFDPVMTDVTEAAALDRFHWWEIADLTHATEHLTPRSLAEIITEYLASGAPQGSIEVEVLVD